MRYFSKNLLPSFLLCLFIISCGEGIEPSEEPQQAEEGVKESALEEGSASLQSTAPLETFDVYLVGFHPLKEEPAHQLEVHHFCSQANDEFAQCVLFDGNTEEANLNGIEYIISERLFESLPEEEKQYWHPRNYEILSGQLVAPGLSDKASKELMKGEINSYGKTFHMWDTGTLNDTGDELPLGDPNLAWSLNRDGEAIPGIIGQRDTSMSINTQEIRNQRKEFIDLANPQEGVNELRGDFHDTTSAIPGVVDKSEQDSVQQDTASQDSL